MIAAYNKTVYLASRSPRRKDLLNQLGIQFKLLDVDIDESVGDQEMPEDYVLRMAREKANAAWEQHGFDKQQHTLDSAILSADTSVVLRQKILGKPKDKSEAGEMLQSLSGKSHQVITAVAVKNQKTTRVLSSITQVEFASLSADDIQSYCQCAEGMGKAGAYAIQGKAAQFIVSINGSYSGVVGLPLYQTSELLKLHAMDFS